MSEHDDEAQRARGFADRIQAAGVRHAAMKCAAAPTGTPEATTAAAVEAVTRRPSPMTPEERAEIEALLPPDLRYGRSSALALCSEYERSALASVVLGLLRRARAAESIVAGRETEPTHEEFLAQDRAGGGWLVAYVTPSTQPGHQCVRAVRNYVDARGFLASLSYSRGKVIRWWALATDGAPGVWPVPQSDDVEVLVRKTESVR